MRQTDRQMGRDGSRVTHMEVCPGKGRLTVRRVGRGRRHQRVRDVETPRAVGYHAMGGSWEGGALGRERWAGWGRLLTPASCHLSSPHPAAYKEKMKELSVLSLICSCFYSQPHPNTIYQYGGECARAPTCGFQNPLVHLA